MKKKILCLVLMAGLVLTGCDSYADDVAYNKTIKATYISQKDTYNAGTKTNDYYLYVNLNGQKLQLQIRNQAETSLESLAKAQEILNNKPLKLQIIYNTKSKVAQGIAVEK